MPNLFAGIPSELPAEFVETLAAAGEVRIERIVSFGHASAVDFWYEQSRQEFVLLVAGAAIIEFADSEPTVELKPGDHLTIPAHCKHRVHWTTSEENTVWLAVHFD